MKAVIFLQKSLINPKMRKSLIILVDKFVCAQVAFIPLLRIVSTDAIVSGCKRPTPQFLNEKY